MNLVDLARHFSDEDKAREFLEKKRWPDGPVCPHCGLAGEAYRLNPTQNGKTHVRKGVWKCAGCRKEFSVTVGTIFEDSHIPLHKWLLAFHLLCSSKKGMSAHQLHRMLGITYKSAWFMAHRIRYAMAEEPLSSKLDGIIEIDETYIGGKLRTGPQAAQAGKRPLDRPAGTANKAPVVSVLQRGGRVEKVTAKNLKPIIEQMASENAIMMTDDSSVLGSTSGGRQHYKVNHSAEEYVRHEGNLCITTNGVEGYFSILKRGVNGVYHHWSKNISTGIFPSSTSDIMHGKSAMAREPSLP